MEITLSAAEYHRGAQMRQCMRLNDTEFSLLGPAKPQQFQMVQLNG